MAPALGADPWKDSVSNRGEEDDFGRTRSCVPDAVRVRCPLGIHGRSGRLSVYTGGRGLGQGRTFGSRRSKAGVSDELHGLRLP